MIFNNEDLEILKPHISTYAAIIRNRACSNLSIEAREVLFSMAKKCGLTNICSTCPSSILYTISRVYGQYLNDYQSENYARQSKRTKRKKKGNDTEE